MSLCGAGLCGAGLGPGGWGVKCSGIGIACCVITWPCHVIKFACFHRRTGKTFRSVRVWGDAGAEGVPWCGRGSSGVCVRLTGPCWHGGRRQHGLARARLHFESGLWPLHPSAPMYAAEGTEGEGEGQASWGMPAGAWSCVAGGRAAGRAASAQLRPGEDEDGVAPCDRLRRAVVGAGRLSVQHDEERGSAPRLCRALAWWGCRPAQTQSSTGQSAAGRRPAARGMS